MKKNVLIIGGGISGLCVLHELKEKYKNRSDVDVKLFEKSDFVGGTIKTQSDGEYLFEAGPNGFLGNQPATFELIKQLGLEGELILAHAQANKRFVCWDSKLYLFPTDHFSFFTFGLLSVSDKLRILSEFFIPKGVEEGETIYDFAKRRFGIKAAQFIFDPVLCGIYAGDIKQLNVSATLPRIFELEQKHGSIIKGMMASRKKLSQLYSFKKGMGQLIDALHRRYAAHIHTQQEALKINYLKYQYVVDTLRARYQADELFLCLPAYSAQKITAGLSRVLSEQLCQISYAPVAVVGLVYRQLSFIKKFDGFGYLRSSLENKNILGVLFENNVFEGRCPTDQVLIRVMMAGAHHPFTVGRSANELIAMAQEEMARVFGLSGNLVKTFFSVWPQAIPQYTMEYVERKQKILKECGQFPHLHLVANYLDGVSFNDCVRNAKLAVEKIKI